MVIIHPAHKEEPCLVSGIVWFNNVGFAEPMALESIVIVHEHDPGFCKVGINSVNRASDFVFY
jgi:hypothetical protein